MGRSGAGWQGLLCNTATSLPPTMYYAGELLVCLQPPRSRDPRHPRERQPASRRRAFCAAADRQLCVRPPLFVQSAKQWAVGQCWWPVDDTEGWLITRYAGGAFGCGGWPLRQTGRTGFSDSERVFNIWMCDNNSECARGKTFLLVQTKLVVSDLSLSAIKLIKLFLQRQEQITGFYIFSSCSGLHFLNKN